MKVIKGVVLGAAIVGSSIAKPIDSVELIEAEKTATVTSIEDLRALLKAEQRQWGPISPPSIHRFWNLREDVIFVDWKGDWPQSAKKTAIAQLDKNMIPRYDVWVWEEADGTVVIQNAYGQVMAKLAPEKRYNPFGWAEDYFGTDVVSRFSTFQRALYSSSHTAVALTLTPSAFKKVCGEIREEEAVALEMAAASMMMRTMAVENPKPTAHMTQGIDGVDLEISLPVGFGDHIEIFRRNNLMFDSWAVADHWVSTYRSTTVNWTDSAAGNCAFYHISNAIDTDKDGFSDLTEAWGFGGTGSNTFDYIDTDGDSMLDAWEEKLFGNLDWEYFDDADEDGLRNNEEMEYRPGSPPTIVLISDPSLYDTDNDGVNDFDELRGDPMTDPWNPDASAPLLLVGSPASGTTITP